MTLVTILSHFTCTKVHSRFIFENTVGQISIFGKIGNYRRLELKLEH